MDNEWETTRGLFVITSDWAPPNFDQQAFPMATKFAQSKFVSTLLYFFSALHYQHWFVFSHTLLSLIFASSKPSIFLSQEQIDEFFCHGFFHQEKANTLDIDNVSTTEAMKCLTGYAFHLFFIDLANDVFLWHAREQLN